ncbi:hypothetical protein Bhyg_00949 [Pseudolycoriella hygida]|uniref:Uncharacterized protein n=1 Tax=Pseudolycoriella hygida TaxID=35572 RepID=A0A9Q0S6X2_9DIPT|nr:hypothetical protein Bhyg_00949 [Pseudolycoriella hygida]
MSLIPTTDFRFGVDTDHQFFGVELALMIFLTCSLGGASNADLPHRCIELQKIFYIVYTGTMITNTKRKSSMKIMVIPGVNKYMNQMRLQKPSELKSSRRPVSLTGQEGVPSFEMRRAPKHLPYDQFELQQTIKYLKMKSFLCGNREFQAVKFVVDLCKLIVHKTNEPRSNLIRPTCITINGFHTRKLLAYSFILTTHRLTKDSTQRVSSGNNNVDCENLSSPPNSCEHSRKRRAKTTTKKRNL